MHPPIEWAKAIPPESLHALLREAMDSALDETPSITISWVDEEEWRFLACLLWAEFRNIGVCNACFGKSWKQLTNWQNVRYVYFPEFSNAGRQNVLNMENKLQHISGLTKIDGLYNPIMSTYCSDVWCDTWDILMQDRAIPNKKAIRKWLEFTIRNRLRALNP